MSKRNTAPTKASLTRLNLQTAKVVRLLLSTFLLLTFLFNWITPVSADGSGTTTATQTSKSLTNNIISTKANATNVNTDLLTNQSSSAQIAQVQQNLNIQGLQFEENDGQFDP